MSQMVLVNDIKTCIRVIDHGHWHKCLHPCHWPLVNDTNAFGQWHGCVHSCHWPWSMTRMRAFVSLTTGQWHECFWSMTRMHAFVSLTVVNDTDACIRVIDRGQWHGCVHSCHWPLVNDTNACIRVIDRCHWLGVNYHGIGLELISHFLLAWLYVWHELQGFTRLLGTGTKL